MLSYARTILDAGVAPVAAGEAYMAAFHAAQALIFERQGDVPRTHSGVHGAFGRLAKDEPRLGPRYGKLLPDAYEQGDLRLRHRTDGRARPGGSRDSRGWGTHRSRRGRARPVMAATLPPLAPAPARPYPLQAACGGAVPCAARTGGETSTARGSGPTGWWPGSPTTTGRSRPTPTIGAA